MKTRSTTRRAVQPAPRDEYELPKADAEESFSIYSIGSAKTPEEKRAVAAAVRKAQEDMENIEKDSSLQQRGMMTRSKTRIAAVAAATTTRSDSSPPPSAGASEETSSIYSIPSSTSVPTAERTLRAYQSRIADVCEKVNTLVILPTGTGKTIISAEVFRRIPPRALFLVPTCILVEQQAKVLAKWSDRRVAELRGGDKLLRRNFDVLVTTPQAFMNAQKIYAPALGWDTFEVVVFDEVHHTIKDDPYRQLAQSLRRWSVSSSPSRSSSSQSRAPRVLGLTASFTYEVGDAQAKAVLDKMCDELCITKVERASLEELKENGYQAWGVVVEVSLPSVSITPPGTLPVTERIHPVAATFLVREERRENTVFALRLMDCVRSMENTIKAGEYPEFTSPLNLNSDVKVESWGVYAHNYTSKNRGVRPHGRVTQEVQRRGRGDAASTGRQENWQQSKPSPCNSPFTELGYWYEAVKTLVVSWEEREDHAATILDMFKCVGSPTHLRSKQHQEEYAWPAEVLQKIRIFWGGVPKTFPRYEHLRKVLLEKYEHHGGKNTFRGILFVRERVTTHVLAHVIANDNRLATCFSTACLHASSSNTVAPDASSESTVRQNIEAFRSGRVNLLLSTAIAEEGLDIPDANCVFRYDPIDHPLSMIQARGRARKEGSSFVVLRERPDRTTSDFEAIEHRREHLLEKFEPRPSSYTKGHIVEPNSMETGSTRSEKILVPLSAITSVVKNTAERMETAMVSTESDDEVSSDAGRTSTRIETDEGVEEVIETLSVGSGVVAEPQQSLDTDDCAERSTSSLDEAAADVCLTTLQSLEHGARGVLLDAEEKQGLDVVLLQDGTPICPKGMVATLEKFATLTKASIEADFAPASKLWVCTLTYESALRRKRASGEAAIGRKTAKQLAAMKLIADLLRSTARAEPDDVVCPGAGTTSTWIEPDEGVGKVDKSLSAGSRNLANPPPVDTCDFIEQRASSFGEVAVEGDVPLTTLQPPKRGTRGVQLDSPTRRGHGPGVTLSSAGGMLRGEGENSGGESHFSGRTRKEPRRASIEDLRQAWVAAKVAYEEGYSSQAKVAAAYVRYEMCVEEAV